jgi:hypothetical protein
MIPPGRSRLADVLFDAVLLQPLRRTGPGHTPGAVRVAHWCQYITISAFRGQGFSVSVAPKPLFNSLAGSG